MGSTMGQRDADRGKAPECTMRARADGTRSAVPTDRGPRLGTRRSNAMSHMEDTRWVGSWATAPALVEGRPLANQTIRMIAHVSLGGPAVRVRFSNAHGDRKLTIGAARVGLRGKGPDILPGTDRPLAF